LAVTFKTDKAQVERHLIPPLKPGPQPELAFAWFVEWTSISEANPELAYVNPERTQYKEFFIAISCSYEGEAGFTVPYIWVDNDFTLLRGWFQGFPKKLGRIWITKLHPLNPLQGGIKPGVKLKGICESHCERIAEASIKITGRTTHEEMPKPKFYLVRHFPNIEDPSRPSVYELVQSVVENVKYGEVWKGEAGLKLYESEIEEHHFLEPLEILCGYYFSIGLTINGGKVLKRIG